MNLMEELRGLGVNIEEALKRLRGNEELFIELILGIPEDVADYDVGACLQKGDYANAALNAHALKGEMANLGVIPLFDWYDSINRLLKENKVEEAQREYAKGVDTLNTFLECIEKYETFNI